MKKIIFLIIFGFLLAGLILPLASPVWAQIGGQNINACCKIGAKFQALEKKGTGGNAAVDFPIVWDKKCVVGEAGGQCVINGTPVTLLDSNIVFEDKTNATPPHWACGETLPTMIVIDGWGIICLLNTVYIVTNWIFYLMMIGVVILFIIAGAQYMMSQGNPEKTKSTKNLIIYAIVGLVVALIAKLVPSVVKLIVAM